MWVTYHTSASEIKKVPGGPNSGSELTCVYEPNLTVKKLS